MADDAGELTDVDVDTLASVVQSLLDEPAAVVARGRSCRPLGGGAGEGIGLYRVTGSARARGAIHPWELVVKVCAATNGADPESWDYPAREGLALARACSRHCSGLAAPRCLAVEARPDGTTRLWIVALVDEYPGPWTRDLGRFNGASFAGAPLPDQPWLSRGWLRDFVEPSGPAIVEL